MKRRYIPPLLRKKENVKFPICFWTRARRFLCEEEETQKE